jgi:16S rRNA (uracil1498-N3)-methyltransferase
MRLTRVHLPVQLEPGAEIVLPAATGRHVARVLRLKPGATIVGFDGSGWDFPCEMLEVAGDEVRVKVMERRGGLAESPLAITLVQAVSRSDRMDLTLQKAVELGVHSIVPVLSSRSVVRLDARQAERKLRHWRALVTSACEQSGRSRVPGVSPPQELRAYLAVSKRDGQRLMLSPTGPASLAGMASLGPRVELLIGPEGGFEDAELTSAASAGFRPVRLGPRTLRTETAGLVALAVLQALWGDLQ